MRVVAMFRVSTEQQAHEGVSLDAQERQYHTIADQEGWRTVAIYKGSESATQASKDRAVLQDVLACIRKTEPDALYVHEQSRLTRGDELEVAGLLRELRERRLKVIIGGVVRDLSSLDERFMIGIQGLVDRAEAERIKERQQRGKREKARQGLKNSGLTPYGYRNPHRGEPGRGTLQIVPDKAAVVKRVFEMASTGISIGEITKILNADGVPGPRGGVWWKATLARVLANPAYRGCLVSSAWTNKPGSRTFRFDMNRPEAVVVEDAHPGIVTKEVWYAAQEVQPVPRTSRPRLLSGLLTMNGYKATVDTPTRGSIYRPPRGTRGGPWIPCAMAHEVVWRAFVRAVSEPGFLTEVLEEIRAREADESIAGERDRLTKQINKLGARLTRLTDMRAEGEITKAEYLDRSGSARSQIEGLKQQLGVIAQKDGRGDGEMVRKMFAAARVLVASEHKLSDDEKRRVLRRTTRGIDVRATRHPQKQPKNSKGHFQKGGNNPWRIDEIRFELGSEAVSRDGCLDTTW